MKRAVNALQNFGKSLYGPVLILPIVGLFIAFGNVLGNGNLAEYLPFLGHPLIQSVGQLIAKSAVSVLVNLALVFAVGIPIGLATRDKGYAALIGLVTFIVFINAMNVTLQLQGELAPAEQMKAAGQSMVLGVQVLEMGVFAGILTGALSGYLYNKYSGVQFNGAMAIYSGHCFVAIVMLPVSMLLGVVMSELWPYAQHGISALALAINNQRLMQSIYYGTAETAASILPRASWAYDSEVPVYRTGRYAGGVWRNLSGRAQYLLRRDGLPGREAAQQYRGVGCARHQQDVRPSCRRAGDVHDREARA